MAALDRVAADEFPEPIEKDKVPFGADIGLAVLCFEKPLFRRLDGPEDRRASGLVAIDSDAEIDIPVRSSFLNRPIRASKGSPGLRSRASNMVSTQ